MKARIASIFTQLVNFCWSFFKWTLLLACVGAVAAGGYLYLRLDDEIRRQVEMRFAKHYRDFVVKVGSARFDPQRGIAIDDFSLTPKNGDGNNEPILTIDELYLTGKMRVEQLVMNQLQISNILVRKAKVRMVRQPDGTWNTAALFPLPHFSDDFPTITVEDASTTVQYSAQQSKPWLLQGINLKLAPLPLAAGQPHTSVHFQISGNANGLPARALAISGQLGAGDGLLDTAVTVAGLDISPKLLATLPDEATSKLAGTEVSGQADITLKLFRPNAHTPTSWAAAFRVDHGRLFRAPLPEPLTDVVVVGRADSQKLTIEQMGGRCGSATFSLAVNRTGWAANAPLALVAKVTGYTLTEQLQTTLSESQARIWQRFRPLGAVDADLRLTFDGANWKPLLTAKCRGISLTDKEKFPYLVEQTTGDVIYRAADKGSPDQLKLDLTGVGGGRPIKIVADLTHLAPEEPSGPAIGEGVAGERGAPAIPATGAYAAGYRGVRYVRGERLRPAHPVGFVEVSGTDIPLHEQLVVALPKKACDLVRDLHGQGLIDFCFHAEWKDLSQAQCDVRQDIRLKDCRVQFGPFPYPLQHVNGLVTERNGLWALNDFEARGSNDSTIVHCHGGVTPHDSGCEADLTFEATSVPLDDNLRMALGRSPGGQQAWTELNPQGTIDFTAHITRQPNEIEPNVEVALRPTRGRPVSLEMRLFPYRLDELEGTATYRRGRVDWQNVVAHHERSVYSVGSGSWQVTADGGWQCNLSNVSADRLAMSRDLIAAIPPALQTVLDKLQPTGAIGLYNGSFTFAKSPQVQGLAAAWDVTVECQQAALQCAVPLRGINGGVRIVGRSDGRNAYVSGEFGLDTLLCKDVQLTNVRGPFWADATHFLAGEPACKQQNLPQLRRVVADAYGGSTATNIEFVHDGTPAYSADVRLGGANLARFINERIGGPNDLNGTLSGTVVVSGTGTTMQTMRGSGDLHVVDANIYQLPVLVAMLKVLKNRTPDTTAFNRCDMKFAIQGEHVHFEQLNLLGDAVSLYGNGETDLSRRLDLVFYTLVGPVDLPIPGWKTLAGHVSQQGLQLKVVGTLDDPKIERRALPAVNDMLDQMQADFQGSAGGGSSATANRGAKSTR